MFIYEDFYEIHISSIKSHLWNKRQSFPIIIKNTIKISFNIAFLIQEKTLTFSNVTYKISSINVKQIKTFNQGHEPVSGTASYRNGKKYRSSIVRSIRCFCHFSSGLTGSFDTFHSVLNRFRTGSFNWKCRDK